MHKIIVGIFFLFYGLTQSLAYETRVIDGTVVSQNNDMWRFIVAIKQNGGQFCGGSLIAKNWVLTAAHCLSQDDGTPLSSDNSYKVSVGAYNINETIDYGVKRFIVHPQYDATTTDNDIALIELDANVTIVPTIAYDKSYTLVDDTQTRVAGWGNMNRSNETPVYPDNLREALVPIVDYDTCNASNAYNGDITTNMLCAGYMDGRRDGCQGDSGGPLVVDNTLVGIVSWGNGCGVVNFPGVYTKVQNYATWIDGYTALKIEKSVQWVPVTIDNIIIFVPVSKPK